MQFSIPLLLTTLITLAIAQNPFLYNGGALTTLTAGSTFTIQWAPSTGTTDTVSLLLRQGNPASLTTVLVIAANITNTGTYTWSLPTSLVNGTLYTFEIYDDLNHDLANYSNDFTILSTNTVSSVIANPVATVTNAGGFLSTVYAIATASGTMGAESPVGTGTGTASASASATGVGNKNGAGRVGAVGISGMGLGVLVGLVVL